MALQNQYQQVVIRFQICIFDILNTAVGFVHIDDRPL